MTNEQTQKPYKFSFPDPWNDKTDCDPSVACEPEPPWELPIGPAPETPEEPLHRKRRALNVVSGEELADMRLDPVRFCVEGLRPEGLSILGGAPKAGKSWLVLDLGIRIARGEPLWGFPTKKGDTLYLCLEDSLNRVQDRLNRITDDPPDNLFFAVSAGTIEDGLCEQIKNFQQNHSELALVVVDTFQVVRSGGTEISYAGEYTEVRLLKALAEELRIALLLVHHLRKKRDKDPLNMISGSTGISGAADAVYVLDRKNRNNLRATLTCTGRDIEQRKLFLNFDSERCRWDCDLDDVEHPEKRLPPEMERFVHFMWTEERFNGSNAELAERFNRCAGTQFTPRALKQKMNQCRYDLEDCGVYFESFRSNGTRMVSVEFHKNENWDDSDEEDANDANLSVPQFASAASLATLKPLRETRHRPVRALPSLEGSVQLPGEEIGDGGL